MELKSAKRTPCLSRFSTQPISPDVLFSNVRCDFLLNAAEQVELRRVVIRCVLRVTEL